jgi:hypothetical protein
MMIAYTKQSSNPLKLVAMPDDYYWEKYEIDETLQEQFANLGYIVLTVENFETQMAAIDLTAYNTAIAPTPTQVVEKKISDAKDFGESILKEFATENVLMGITQAGKTEAVTRYLHFVEHYIEQGSLYAAINEINTKLTEGIPAELSPFVTTARITVFLNKIKVYLGITI